MEKRVFRNIQIGFIKKRREVKKNDEIRIFSN